MVLNMFMESLLQPPTTQLILLLVAWLAWRRLPWVAGVLAAVGLSSLWLLSTPVVSQALIRSLESQYPVLSLEALLLEEQRSRPQAIVVLGAGRAGPAPEYGTEDSPTATLLVRLRYAAYLQRQLELPLLVSGGSVLGEPIPESTVMAEILEEDFQVPVTWREGLSKTTWENARYSAARLKEAEVEHILLVTHASHIPRAVRSFTEQGLQVTPAPTGFRSLKQPSHPAIMWSPSSTALHLSRTALHEWYGSLYYQLFYYD